MLSKIGELYGALAKAIEIPLATANRSLNSNLQTVFLEDRVNVRRYRLATHENRWRPAHLGPAECLRPVLR